VSGSSVSHEILVFSTPHAIRHPVMDDHLIAANKACESRVSWVYIKFNVTPSTVQCTHRNQDHKLKSSGIISNQFRQQDYVDPILIQYYLSYFSTLTFQTWYHSRQSWPQDHGQDEMSFSMDGEFCSCPSVINHNAAKDVAGTYGRMGERFNHNGQC
jgi:hypothetical protein